MEDYVPGTFIWNAEGDYVKTLEPLLSITEEITTRYPQDNMAYNAIVENAFYNAVCSRLKRANKKFNWGDYQNALTYKDLLEGDYATVCELIFETIGKTVHAGPTRDSAYAGAIRGVEKFLTEDLGSYIAVLSEYKEENPVDMQKQQINVLRTIQATQKLRKSVRGYAGRLDLKVHQLTGLTILWCKKSQELLHEWVLSVVKNDKHAPAHAKAYSSTAPIDVSEFVSQVIGQLNEITIDDPFVWTQASELLVSTVLNYIEYESTYACGYFNSTVISYQKKLEFVCVALSNIEKVQETLNDVIEEIEGFMERWRKTHLSQRVSRLSPASPTRSIVTLSTSDMSYEGAGAPGEEELNIQLDQSAPAFAGSDDEDSDAMRMEVTTATVNDAISFAIAKSKKWMAAPLGLMGKHAADEITGIVIAGIAGKKTAEAALGEVSAYYDDELSAISDHVTQRMLKRALEEYLCSLLQRVWDVSRPDYALSHADETGAMDFTKTETCDRCTRIVEGLIEYFHAGGEGINKQIIARNKLYKSILQIIDAYKLSTEELITIVKHLTATPPAPLEDKKFEGIDPVLVDLIIRNKATTGDKWAIAYSKEGAGSEESTIVRTQLGLPPSEFLISSNF